MPTSIPSVAATGFANASKYDAHRPSFPQPAVESLLTNLRVSGVKGACILDLGAGTGKFTELLAQRDEGFEIIAVEPHGGMRKELERKGLRGVKLMEGSAEKMSVETGEVDAVVVAQVGLDYDTSWFLVPEVLNCDFMFLLGIPLVCCLPH